MCKEYNDFAELGPAETTPVGGETESEASKDGHFEMKVDSNHLVDEVLDRSVIAEQHETIDEITSAYRKVKVHCRCIRSYKFGG